MLRVGIFFGGPSREREISFAGGRTVFDNLDKALFEAVPVFVDSLGNFIRLDWQYLYKGTIRDFYPPPALVPQFVPPTDEPWQVYIESLGALTRAQQDELARAVGEPIEPRDFRSLFDFAFLTLHGPYGEDGAIQGVLDWAGVPYSGAGLLPSAIGIDKIAQKRLLQRMGFATPEFQTLTLDEWNAPDPAARPATFARLQAALGLPFVVKAPHQGSSIGVSVVSDAVGFEAAVNRSLFQQEIGGATWAAYSAEQKKHFVRTLADIRSGIGLPVQVGEGGPVVQHPAELVGALDAAFARASSPPGPLSPGEGEGGAVTEDRAHLLFGNWATGDSRITSSTLPHAQEMRREPTVAENALWQALRNRQLEDHKFRRQHPIGLFITDFVCLEAGVVVEVDGEYHNAEAQEEIDAARTRELKQRGFRVVRVTNEEVLRTLPEALKRIAVALSESSPPAPLQGRGEPLSILSPVSPSPLERGAGGEEVRLLALTDAETAVLVERFVRGREFSCIVLETPDGTPLALPPTEIVKGAEVFDYRAKYLPGMARKVTPMDVPAAEIQRIRARCAELFEAFQFSVYARLDGFYTAEGEIFLNDPNTTSGMLPASFFFHQAAEIGLNPSQLITTIIRTSLAARAREGKRAHQLRAMLGELDVALAAQQAGGDQRIPVAIVLGGYSSERHISVESGRNIYEKLASSAKYRPVPVFLSGDRASWRLHVLPINLLLKDNADDIRDQILKAEAGHGHHPVLDEIRVEAAPVTARFAGAALREPRLISLPELAQEVKAVFIALHGRPGEDGALQRELEKVGLPYNGSGADTSAVTINKFVTNQTLRAHGIRVADHQLVTRAAWDADAGAFCRKIERGFGFPLIAKPADDGCSSAVKKLDNPAELAAFTRLIFRDAEELDAADCAILNLSRGEEFPRKTEFVIETLIGPDGARTFLEVTGGLLTHRRPDSGITYEIFEASEALATGSVLSLEEKFLAGEGQNITPARYAADPEERQRISEEVKKVLHRVAEILHVEGYARIDAFVRIRGGAEAGGAVEVIIIEVNSLPGMTPATCIFHQTALAGYSPYEFIDRILEFGATRIPIPLS